MEDNKIFGEQPSVSTTSTAGADIETGSVVESNGSPIGKFKDVKSLNDAYNSLQAEFTKKCQQLSELTKQKNDNAQAPFFESENWQARLDEFFNKNPQALKYSKQIAEVVVGDKELQKGSFPLMEAYAKVLEQQNINLLNNQQDEEKFVENLSEQTKEKIVTDYLSKLNVAPTLMQGFGGVSVASTVNQPKTVAEAGELAKKLFK